MDNDKLDGLEACERFRRIVNDRFRFLSVTYGFEVAEAGCMFFTAVSSQCLGVRVSLTS